MIDRSTATAPNFWRSDEFILLVNYFFQEDYKKEIIQSEALKYIQSLNLYFSSLQVVHAKSIEDIQDIFTKFEQWSSEGTISYCPYEQKVFNDLQQSLSSVNSISKALKIFINSWLVLSLSEDHQSTEAEGALLEKQHFIRERDQHIIKAKKVSVLREKGGLCCEVCSFNFLDKYGMHGINYCEVHHLKPLSKNNHNNITLLDDLAILCSNCHRMIHRKNPWLSLLDLKEIISFKKEIKVA
ncbi:HNH endonuclease [Gammaproteobacteria bacterium]|nr:HNH endonuclease [Gammaproteobacteria bacterium]